MSDVHRTVRLKKTALFAFVAVAVLANDASWAQTAADVRRGRAVARDVCAQCHAVENFPAASPNPEAPSFYSIAQRSDMTEMALYMAVRTPHDDMPTLVPDLADLDTVIDYIWSLQGRER